MDNRLSAQEKIKIYINHLLTERYIRLQPHRLIKEVQKAFSDQRCTQVRTTIRAMIAEGVLAYTNVLSSTFIVRKQKLGLQVSTAFQQNPDAIRPNQRIQTIPIHLSDGLAFGDGEHPTTQLCLKGIETLMQGDLQTDPISRPTVLDIGTGTGVLAIAAALLGAEKVIAIDMDPMACREARINVDLNLVAARISIVAGDMSVLKGLKFDLVLANLRGPTLTTLLGRISASINPGGMAIFSGFRPEEGNTVAAVFRKPQWQKIWDSNDRGWVAMAVAHNAGS